MNDHILIGRGLLVALYFLLGITCWANANAAFRKRAAFLTTIWGSLALGYFCFVIDTFRAPAVLP